MRVLSFNLTSKRKQHHDAEVVVYTDHTSVIHTYQLCSAFMVDIRSNITGRIDRKIEFPLPDEKTKRRIFTIHTGRMTLAEDVNLEEYVMAKDDLSGADIKVHNSQHFACACTSVQSLVLISRSHAGVGFMSFSWWKNFENQLFLGMLDDVLHVPNTARTRNHYKKVCNQEPL